MGYGHPLALRSRIIDAVTAGAAAREAARRFAVSPSSAINLVRRWRETGSYAPGRVGGQKKRKLCGREDWLHAVMASEPDNHPGRTAIAAGGRGRRDLAAGDQHHAARARLQL